MTKSYRDIRVGETVPFDYPRKAVGAPLEAWDGTPRFAWFIFVTLPQRETAARHWLLRNGADEAWYPTEMAWRILPHGPRRKVKYRRPIAPRYVFARFWYQPNWDIIREHARRHIVGVVGRHGEPLELAEVELAWMRQVPVTLRGLKAQVERETRKAEDASRPVAGQRARLLDGPFRDFVVDVKSIHAGLAKWVLRRDGRELPGESHVELLKRA